MKKQFSLIDVNGHHHVIIRINRGDATKISGKKTIITPMPQPNYRNTGMALCGVLKPGQTLDQFTATYKCTGNNPKPRKKRA